MATDSNEQPPNPDLRYDLTSTYRWGDVVFTLTRPEPSEEDGRCLLLKIIEQAIRDYINLKDATSAADQLSYQTAEGFLFDDDYSINFGDKEMSILEVADAVGIDAEWLRRKVLGIRASRERVLEEEGITILG